MTLFEEAATDAEKQTKRERPGGWIVWLVVVVLLAIVGGGYAAGYYFAGDKVPRGTTVSGVELGGLTRAEALDKLQSTFDKRADQPIEVSVDDTRSAQVKPDEVGLTVDYEATLDAAGAARSWSPERQWDYYAGGGKVEAVVEYDERLLATKLTALTKGLGTPPKDGRVLFDKAGKVRTVDPAAGRAIDKQAAREALTAAYLGREDSAQLDVVAAEPEIDAKDVTRAVKDLAKPAVAGPVTLVFGDSDVTLQPATFAKALKLAPENGALALQVKPKVLTGLVRDATSQGKPVDARVRLVSGKPQVVPAKPGVKFETATVSSVFLGLVKATGGKRKGKVESKVQQADFTTKEAEGLKIVEKVAEFSTFYPHAEYRNVNIGRAAELVSGTVLKPGETFSLNGTVGERTAENGFTRGYIIDDGVLRQDYGGGVSQLATTLFNGMFFAGLKDIEHKPHSFYIDRYPVGREATVAWPTVDLRFQNDTDYGVLINAWVEPSNYSRQGKVTVQMWSTKIWDIESQTSGRYGYVSPTTRYLQTADCEAHTGWSGFQVDVTRIFRKHGSSSVDHTEKFHTNYTASDTVVCGPPPGSKPPAKPSAKPSSGQDGQDGGNAD